MNDFNKYDAKIGKSVQSKTVSDIISLNEIYVSFREKEYVLDKIKTLCNKYRNRNSSDYVQLRALFRSYCHDTIKVFDDCFETSMLGMIRCKKRVETYQALDNIEIDKATFDILNMLWDLNVIVKSMVPINDLPSCRKLLNLTPEDIIAKAKDLIKYDIVKASVGVYLLGSKIDDALKIEDVRSYYIGRMTQLDHELQIKCKPICPIEQYLLDKFNAEIGYCNMALLKTGIGITEELKGLVEIGKKHIEKFESQWITGSGTCNLCIGNSAL